MTVFPLPPDEGGRLAALRRYEILDSAPEEAFDRVTQLAASLFATPIAFVSFIDADRQWFKSRVGLPVTETPRAISLCAHTIMSTEVCAVPNALADPRFSDNPIVQGPPHIRFYVGAPLVTRDGFRLGSLCVMDHQPRAEISAESCDRLKTLAHLLMNELELRLELTARARAERDLKLVNDLMLAFVEAPDVSAAMEASLRLICHAVGATYGRGWSAIAGSNHCRLIAAWGPHGSESAKRLEQHRTSPLTLTNSVVGAVLSENKRRVVRSIDAADYAYAAMRDALAIAVKSAVCVPVCQDGRTFALNFLFENEIPEIEAMADRIEDLASKIRPVLVRKLAEERITLLQSVVLHANDAVLIADTDGGADQGYGARIIYASPALTRMTGYGLDELHGRPPAMLWQSASNEEVSRAFQHALERDQPSRFEVECLRKDGSRFWAEISAVPVHDDATRDRKLIAILRDTTERRRLEEALRASETTFRMLFSSNPIPMWAYDLRSRRLLEVNDSAVEQYGYSREQFLTMTMDGLLPASRVEADAAAEDFGRVGFRAHRRADGSEITVDVVSHRLAFQGHEAVLVAAIDMTEQKRAEQEIRHAKEAAEAASRAKSELLANMSHELRTPLNAIIGFSEIMQAGLFGPLGSVRYDGYVADIRHSAAHLLTVITDILDLAKIEANSFRLEECTIDPGQIIASALRLVKPRADSAGVAIRYDERHNNAIVHVDETALKRVLINLLSNAVKFSEAGTTVLVRSDFDAQGCFTIAVVDQGIGMAPEEIPVALTPFRQVNSGLQRKYEGTGLGLPIAKQLVEMHGGTLSIESAAGVGTNVTIRLPAARVMAAA